LKQSRFSNGARVMNTPLETLGKTQRFFEPLRDAARARASTKRGGGMQRVEHTSALNLDALPGTTTNRAAEMCALDDALSALAKREPRRAQVIELRYFGGLTVEETADTLGVSPQTVMRDWKLGRAWLVAELLRS